MAQNLVNFIRYPSSTLRPAIASLQLIVFKSEYFDSSQSGKWKGRRPLTYVQGQSPRKGVREYFYYIDHQGQLFLDDTKVKNFITCFKDKQFLAFFFTRLKVNSSGIFDSEFPYISPCGREINYVRCDDRPIVFSSFVENIAEEPEKGLYHLTFNGIGPRMKFEFQPHKLCMLPKSGRIYHPGPEKSGGVGLVKSSLAIELSRYFIHKKGRPDIDPPTHFLWNGTEHELDNELWNVLCDSDDAAVQ